MGAETKVYVTVIKLENTPGVQNTAVGGSALSAIPTKIEVYEVMAITKSAAEEEVGKIPGVVYILDSSYDVPKDTEKIGIRNLVEFLTGLEMFSSI